jgi:hypothetical protein
MIAGSRILVDLDTQLEHRNILAWGAASDTSLVILALVSYLAGLHFERLFLLLGIILAIFAVIGALVEQYTLWLIVIPMSVSLRCYL